MSSKVEHVFFVDINHINRKFVEYRAKELGLDKKFTFCKTIKDTQISKFDTIVCLDVLEHLAEPASQIKIFNEIMDFPSRWSSLARPVIFKVADGCNSNARDEIIGELR